MQQQKLLIVAATRVAPSPFMESAPLGRSLRRLSFDRRLEARPAFNNREGLPAVYNRQISEENREKILLFVHDDIWLDEEENFLPVLLADLPVVHHWQAFAIVE